MIDGNTGKNVLKTELGGVSYSFSFLNIIINTHNTQHTVGKTISMARLGLMNSVIACLQVSFVVMSWTVEREYCAGPLEPSSEKFLIEATYNFGLKYNPYFHARPEWLVAATCLHYQYFGFVYGLIFIVAVSDGWHTTWIPRLVLPTVVGCKLYAILFYHYMEFTSDQPPPNLLAYFGAEGSYLLSIVLVYYKLITSMTTTTKDPTKKLQ